MKIHYLQLINVLCEYVNEYDDLLMNKLYPFLSDNSIIQYHIQLILQVYIFTFIFIFN